MTKSRGRKLSKKVKYNKILIRAFILILSILIILVLVNFFYKKIDKDSLVTKCTDSFNKCKDANMEKNGISLVLLGKDKFSSKEKAKEFFDKWKASLLQENFDEEIKSAQYPLVLLASSIEKGDVKINFVIVCEKNGNIVEWTKKQLDC